MNLNWLGVKKNKKKPMKNPRLRWVWLAGAPFLQWYDGKKLSESQWI